VQGCHTFQDTDRTRTTSRQRRIERATTRRTIARILQTAAATMKWAIATSRIVSQILSGRWVWFGLLDLFLTIERCSAMQGIHLDGDGHNVQCSGELGRAV
jgi:hypothetical protein